MTRRRQKKSTSRQPGTAAVSPRSRSFFRIGAFLLLLAVLLRLPEFFSALQYDEIWTLQEYAPLPVGRIFTDLALPNNQPLNTLCVKLLFPLAFAVQLIRLHSLAAGIAGTFLAGVAGFLLFRRRSAALWSMAFFACCTPCIVYSQLARGYGLQLFCLLLFGIGVALWGRLARFPHLPGLCILLGGSGAALSVTTSAVYLPGILLGIWWTSACRPPRKLVLLLALCALAGGLWYGFLAPQILQGRQWSTPLDSPSAALCFYGKTLLALLPLWWCLPLAAGLPKGGRLLLPVLFLAGGSALLTGGGPARVYLVLAALFALLAGGGADTLVRKCPGPRWKYLMGALMVLCCAAGSREARSIWCEPDMAAVFDQAARRPVQELIVFRATTSYVVGWNCFPRAQEDFQRRLSAPSTSLLFFAPAGCCNGVDVSGSEKDFALPCQGEAADFHGVTARRYALKPGPPRAWREGSAWLAVASPLFPGSGKALRDVLLPGADVLRLNVFMSSPVRENDPRSHWLLGIRIREVQKIKYTPGSLGENWYEIREFQKGEP